MFLKSEKNRLFVAVERAGVAMEELYYEESTPYRLRISVRSCDALWMSIEKSKKGQFLVWRSDFSHIEGVPVTRDLLAMNTITQAAHMVERWIKTDIARYVKERDAPDLWDQWQRGNDALPKLLGPATISDDAPFTPNERRRLRFALQQFRIAILRELPADEKSRDLVDWKLDRLGDALEKDLSRMEWRGVAINTLIGIATALTLSPEKARQLFALLRDAILTAFRALP